jgi:hypothetical protein
MEKLELVNILSKKLIKTDQYIIFYFFLKRFNIIFINLDYFIFDNISNNNIIFIKLKKKLNLKINNYNI